MIHLFKKEGKTKIVELIAVSSSCGKEEERNRELRQIVMEKGNGLKMHRWEKEQIERKRMR